jgi:glycosyltransferase involved in cell wall biosynthesis
LTRLLLIARCPAWPLHLGDRLILYHLLEELSHDDSITIDLLAFAERPPDYAEVDHYDHYARSVELIPAPTRSKAALLWRALYPPARFPRRADQSWSPAMWQAIERRLATQSYDIVHLFGGVQVYEFAHLLRGLPIIITPYESYSLYLSRGVMSSQFTVHSSQQGGHRKGAASDQLPASSRTKESSEEKPSPSSSSLVTRHSSPPPSSPHHPITSSPVQAISHQLSAISQLLLARQYERFMFTPYQRVTVVAEPDAATLRTLNPALRVEVIPNGVDTHHFRPRPVKRVPALLFLGNYEYAPNVDAALRLVGDIYPQLWDIYPNLRLWLVGNAPPPELQVLASDSIRVTGRVPDVRPYLARAAAFVCPLQFGAGIKNKVLEALAMGCPVVATPLSVDGINVQDGIHALVAEGEGMVNAVTRLLADATLGVRLGVAGRALIEAEYSWAGVAAQYRALYADLISG